MSKPRFYIGQLDQATFTMTETENDGFPLSNLKTYFAEYLWLSSSAVAGQRLILDWGAAKECDFAIFENHNFATIGADDVKLQAADDAGFTTGVVTLSAALASLGSPGKIEFTAQTKRYWSILFERASGNLDAMPQLGQMFVNKKFEVTKGYSFGYRSGNVEFDTHAKINLAGIELTHQNYAGRTVFEFKFSLQSDDFKTNWISLCNSARGKLNPFYYLDPDDGTWYVSLVDDYNPVRTLQAAIHETDTIALKERRRLTIPTIGYGDDYGESYGRGI